MEGALRLCHVLVSGRSRSWLGNHGVSQLAGAAQVTPLPVAINILGQFPFLVHLLRKIPGSAFPGAGQGSHPGLWGSWVWSVLACPSQGQVSAAPRRQVQGQHLCEKCRVLI